MFLSRPPSKIPTLLPAVLTADREHAASVGDLNLSGPFNQSERTLSEDPAPTQSRATEPLPWVSHYRPSLSRGILSLSELSQSASQHRAAAGTHNLQGAPLHVTHFTRSSLLSGNCLTEQAYKVSKDLHFSKNDNHKIFKQSSGILCSLLTFNLTHMYFYMDVEMH